MDDCSIRAGSLVQVVRLVGSQPDFLPDAQSLPGFQADCPVGSVWADSIQVDSKPAGFRGARRQGSRWRAWPEAPAEPSAPGRWRDASAASARD